MTSTANPKRTKKLSVKKQTIKDLEVGARKGHDVKGGGYSRDCDTSGPIKQSNITTC